MAEDKKPKNTSIFQTAGELFKAKLEESLFKARSEIAKQEDNAVYQKSVHRDFTFSTGASGYHEKSSAITFDYEKQMARKNTIVAGIIKTRQNQGAEFTKPVKEKHEAGFKISLKDEQAKLDEIIENLKAGKLDDASKNIISGKSDLKKSKLRKALDVVEGSEESEEEYSEEDYTEGISEKDVERLAQEILKTQTKKKIKELTQYMLSCGNMKDRPFETKKWNFDSLIRTLIADTYTYDWISIEKIPEDKNIKKIHHFVPTDSTTVRYSSPTLATYNKASLTTGANILYPEKELESLEERDALELDPEKLENGDYKFVQKIKGIIVRAFTSDELSVGMRNPVTDIYANGYSVSELELLATTVSAHIFTENYKRTYFSNGFSAKGILHIKAPLNRRKLEALRIQWKHMVSGPKNSFQTPIFAGMDEVKWIPLNQGNIDQEFTNWMQYLIKIICMIYQIDPSEIGFGMKEEGAGGGGGLGGDSTEEKLAHSKSKGLIPLMKFLESFLNTNIIDYLDADYKLEFVGLSDESNKQSIERQDKEIKYKKSVNEIRAEDGLPPFPGCDELILDPTYFQWFMQFSEDGKKLAADQQHQMEQDGVDEQITQDSAISDEETQLQNQGVDDQIQQDSDADDLDATEAEAGLRDAAGGEDTLGGVLPKGDEQKPVKKSLSIEYYNFSEED